MLRTFRRPDDDEHVRGDYRSRVAFLVVDEHVPAHVHVLPASEVHPEHVQRIEHRDELELGLRHRLVIRAGVVHHDAGRYGLTHRQASRRGMERRRAARATVPRPCMCLQSRCGAAAPRPVLRPRGQRRVAGRTTGRNRHIARLTVRIRPAGPWSSGRLSGGRSRCRSAKTGRPHRAVRFRPLQSR